MSVRTVLTDWPALLGMRLIQLARQEGHYIIEIDNQTDLAPRWRVYGLGEQPGRWEQPRITRPKPTA